MKTLSRLVLGMGSAAVGILTLLALAAYANADSSDSGLPNTAAIPVSADRQTASIQAPACTPDLFVTKKVSPGHPLQPGDALTYTITYFNNSPDPAPYVVVMDHLPGGIRRTGSSSIPNREPPVGAGSVWVWRIGIVEAWHGGVITLRAVVDTGIPWSQLTTVTNWVAIIGGNRDCDLTNNFDSVSQSVVPGDPHTVTLMSVPGTVTATGTALVTATVTDRWGNRVRDGTPITFTADSLGTFVTKQPRMTLNGVATSTFQAGAVAGVSIVTGTTATAWGTSSITITSSAAYTLTLQADPILQVVGGSSVLTATVTDQSGRPVSGATVTFVTDLGSVLSPRATMNGVATSQISSTVAGTAHITATSGVAQNTAVVTFTSGAAYTVTLQADPALLIADGVSTSAITATILDQLGNPVADGTRVDFDATLGSVSTPHMTVNGQAVATFTAGSVAGTATVTATANDRSGSIHLTLSPGSVDLSSSVKLASTDVITRVGPLTYTIILTNSGNLVAANVVLTDPIPLGTVFMPGSLSGGAIYNPSLDQIEWSGPVPKGGSVRLSFAVTVTIIEPATIINAAYVSLDGVLDRILTSETRIIPAFSPAPGNIYLPLIMRYNP